MKEHTHTITAQHPLEVPNTDIAEVECWQSSHWFRVSYFTRTHLSLSEGGGSFLTGKPIVAADGMNNSLRTLKEEGGESVTPGEFNQLLKNKLSADLLITY